MGDPHGRVGNVDVLAARARRAISVHAKVFILDFDLDVLVDLGIDEHRGEAGLAARPGVERAQSDQPVHAGFGREQTRRRTRRRQ